MFLWVCFKYFHKYINITNTLANPHITKTISFQQTSNMRRPSYSTPLIQNFQHWIIDFGISVIRYNTYNFKPIFNTTRMIIKWYRVFSYFSHYCLLRCACNILSSVGGTRKVPFMSSYTTLISIYYIYRKNTESSLCAIFHHSNHYLL